MTILERALLDALVAAEFWLSVGEPERTDWATIHHLSYRLHYRARQGRAILIRKPSRLNP